MLLEVIISLATLIIALNGLLFQPKKDVNKSISWTNINTSGKLIIFLLLLITSASVIQYNISKKIASPTKTQRLKVDSLE